MDDFDVKFIIGVSKCTVGSVRAKVHIEEMLAELLFILQGVVVEFVFVVGIFAVLLVPAVNRKLAELGEILD